MSNSNMPTGASGFVPRRSSYASVVSGTAAGSPHQYSQVMRSGAFAHLAHSEADPGYDHTTYHNLSGHLRHESRGLDMDLNMNGVIHGRAGSWGRGGQLPSFSSAFGPLVHGYGYGSLGGGHVDHFFTPSYLKGSKYVQRLEDAHRAKVAAQKEVHSAQSSQPGSLSTSASSLNLHTKIAPSHRGMTYDLIEKAPPVEYETLAPLPSRWNGQDKYGGLEILSDGQEVKFTGPKSERDRDLEACAIRADHPMPPQCGIYYFEVTILSKKREESSIGIGFSSKNVPLSRLPGWEPESWAYHGDDGQTFCSNSTGKPYGPAFNAGDIIGCGINFRSNFSFFTKNGVHLGTAFRDINKEKLYPSVGMKKSGEHVRVNFGQGPFVYDIDGMMSASNHFSYVRTPFGDIRSDTIPDFSSTSIFPRSIRDGSQPTAVAALQLLDILEDSGDVPPLLPPSPPLRPATSVRVERAGATSVNIIFDSDGTVAATSRRSARTVGLLGILEQQSTERTLLNTERHVIRIAASLDEHRGSLLASIPPVRDSNIHWRRIAASERALDDLVDRVIVRLLPPASLSTAGMSGSYRESRAEQLYLREWQIVRMRQDFEEIMPRNSIRGRRDEPNFTRTFTDIQIQQEREQIRQQIDATSTAKLASPLDETDLIQSLVLQFLTHEGYVETARAFAGEVYSEKQALSLDPNVPIQGFHVREDDDAGHRNHIRKAVLEGEIDTALKYTQTFYPNVLRDNEHVSFRLKCRKFIEMIRQAAEMLNSNHSNVVKKSNGHNGDWYEDVAHNMDLDDHQSQANNWDRMDTEEYPQNRTEYQQLLEETLSYGKALQAEYKDDPRREINKALEDAFALMAYTDPLIVKEVSHQLDPSGRAAVAEELSSAILLSLGKSSTAALERLIQQSTVLLEELGEAGGPGSFVSIDDFVKIKDSRET